MNFLKASDKFRNVANESVVPPAGQPLLVVGTEGERGRREKQPEDPLSFDYE